MPDDMDEVIALSNDMSLRASLEVEYGVSAYKDHYRDDAALHFAASLAYASIAQAAEARIARFINQASLEELRELRGSMQRAIATR